MLKNDLMSSNISLQEIVFHLFTDQNWLFVNIL